MPQITTVLLTAKGDLRKANLQLQENNELTLETIQKYFKKKEAPEQVCYYEHDNKIIFIFGYTSGKKDKESQVKLPDPNETIQLYGDSLVIVSLTSKWQTPISYSIDQWNNFLNRDSENEIILDTKINVKKAVKNTKNIGKTVKDKELVQKTPIKTTIEKQVISIDKNKTINTKSSKQIIKKPVVNDSDSEEENDESDSDEDDDVLSDAGTEKSVKDDYADSDSDTDSLSINDSDSDNEKEENNDEENDELEPEPILVKKRKTATLTAKSDANNFKDDVYKTDKPEANKIRALCLKSFDFLEKEFLTGEVTMLEQVIFELALSNAEKHYIPKNWKCPQFIELYRQIVRSVLSNIHPLSPVSNPRLLKRVQEGEFELSTIPKMTSYEMYPEKWFTLRDKQLQREQKILEGNKSRATDQFKCRRCNKRECTYYELQTRSADEPMTIFITCLNCGKEWRGGG